MGALQIPIGTYHRSQPENKGSIFLNQATRDKNFDPKKEFLPVTLRCNIQLRKQRQVNPANWIWDKDKIKRIKINYQSSSNKKGKTTQSIYKSSIIQE